MSKFGGSKMAKAEMSSYGYRAFKGPENGNGDSVMYYLVRDWIYPWGWVLPR